MASKRKDPELVAFMNEMLKKAKRAIKDEEENELNEILKHKTEAKGKGTGQKKRKT